MMEGWVYKIFETSVTGALLLFVLWQVFKNMIPKLENIANAVERNTDMLNEATHEIRELRSAIMKTLERENKNEKA